MRAFAISAVLILLGAGAIVGGSVVGAAVLGGVVGTVLLLAGVALAVLAVVAARGQSVTVRFDTDGFVVEEPGHRRHGGSWSTVTRVTRAPGRISLHEGEERRTHLVAPTGSSADLDAIGAAISRHLDRDRGYTAYQG